MVTKVFISQIDSTQSDGSTADNNSILRVISGNSVWYAGEYAGGITGYPGSIGYFGSFGTTGYEGSQGSLGFIGSSGIIGFKGSAGISLVEGNGGFKGSQGNLGTPGTRGISGYRGSAGVVGYIGSSGGYSFTGSAGYKGSLGFIGSAGYRGSLGYIGSKGDFIPGGFKFNQFLDFSPNTYSARSLITVNSSATGITQTSNTFYVTSSLNSANLNFNTPNYPNTLYLNYPAIRSYSETFSNISSSTNSGVIVLDFSKGKIFNILLDTATSVVNGPDQGDLEFRGQTITATLYLKQDGSGNRLVNWWSNIYWPVGEGIPSTGPVLSREPNTTDVITLTTFDGMATWYGSIIGKTFY